MRILARSSVPVIGGRADAARSKVMTVGTDARPDTGVRE